LVESVDPASADRWRHFPGEDRAPVAPTRLEAERADDSAPTPETSTEAMDSLEAGEVQAVRPLSWYARRPVTTPAAPPVIAGGLLVRRAGAPALAPEDGVVRLTSHGDSHLDLPPLRVVPPWTQVRFLPPRRSAAETNQ
jgi:hypothetical protein